MPCQLSYGAVRAVTLLAGQTVSDALQAVKASLPTRWAASFLGIQLGAAETLTDPDTSVGYTAAKGELLLGNHLLEFTATTGVVALAYFTGGNPLVR